MVLIKILIFTVCSSIGFTNAYWHLAWEDQFNGGNLKDRWDFEVNCDGKFYFKQKQIYLIRFLD